MPLSFRETEHTTLGAKVVGLSRPSLPVTLRNSRDAGDVSVSETNRSRLTTKISGQIHGEAEEQAASQIN